MIKYFKESDDTIYEAFTHGKTLLITSMSLHIINKDNKYLEISFSNGKYLMDSIIKTCSEIEFSQYNKIFNKFKKLFKKETDVYEKYRKVDEESNRNKIKDRKTKRQT